MLYRTVDSGSAVDLLIYRCLFTSGLGHFGPGQLVLGTNHFGHRHFPSLGVIPCATIFTSPETRMILLPDSENRMIVASFVSTQYQRVTEDGRTDTAVAIQRLHCKQCGPAVKTLSGQTVRRISLVGEEKVCDGKHLPKKQALSSECKTERVKVVTGKIAKIMNCHV